MATREETRAQRDFNARIYKALTLIRGEGAMPKICYAVTRQYQSKLSGPVRVMIAWRQSLKEAQELAAHVRHAFTCQVERWDKARGSYKSRLIARYRHRPIVETAAA